jgi:hypothetical protein
MSGEAPGSGSSPPDRLSPRARMVLTQVFMFLVGLFLLI